MPVNRTAIPKHRPRRRRRTHAWRRARAALACAAAAALLGCATPAPRQPLPLEEAPAFSSAGEAPLADRWWTAFGDDRLNERVELALADNFSLASAWERLREARAVVRRERAALFPTLDGTAGGELREGSDVDAESQIGLGLNASYEVDLWGRIRSGVEAQRLLAAATEEDYRATAISLSAEVALAWYELAEAWQQLELIGSQIDTNETVLEVIEQRFAVGQANAADVLRQRQLVEATREQAIVTRSRAEALEHLLAVLTGRPPQTAEEPTDARLPAVPALPDTGLPAELLRRRPDVRSAFLRLEAADAQVAAAVRDQYPRLDLTAALTTIAENPAGLFESWLASIAAELVAPLYDAGRREAEVERTVAARRQRLADYGQTALVAFREVEDALARESYQLRRIASLSRQVELAISTLRQLRTQYLNGAAEYLDVLDALRERQQLERSLVTARLDRVAFRIALHRALAGGFLTPAEVAASDPYDPANTFPDGVSAGE